MANSKTSKVIQHLRRAVLLQDGAGLTDGLLLECFLTQRDDAAFAALVQRHGPMVWGVCRRVLHHHHDAEDAFQATFLVLIRKAASVVPKEMVANWLYGVAYQTALKARSVAARRKKRERQVVAMPEPAIEERGVWHDLQPLLDQELSRLPDKYRVPIILCDLEGKTRKEAARQLGWPEGTVAGRLATARKMLAKRLAQRGVSLSGGALAAVLSQKVASAGVPTAVVSSTIKAASLFAAGEAAATGAFSVKVAPLTEGVLKAMFLTKLKIATAVVFLIAVVGVVAWAGGSTVATATPPDVKQANHETTTASKKQAKLGDKPAAAAREETPKDKDEEKIVGTWTYVSVEVGGQKAPEEAVKKAKMTITFAADGKFNAKVKGKIEGTYKLDPAKKPKEITFTDNEGKVRNAIYKLEGDALTICQPDEDGAERPTEFASKEGAKVFLIVLKRDKEQQPEKAKKEQMVLTPEEAIKQRSKEKVTVQFKAASVTVHALEGPQSVGYNEGPYIRLMYSKDFSVLLRGPASYHIERLGIDPAKHFSGKSVRVTGRVLPDPARTITDTNPPTVVDNDKGPPFQIVVDDLDQLEVVKE